MNEETQDPNDQENAEASEEEGPQADQLDEDPAYNPDEEGLKDIKGG